MIHKNWLEVPTLTQFLLLILNRRWYYNIFLNAHSLWIYDECAINHPALVRTVLINFNKSTEVFLLLIIFLKMRTEQTRQRGQNGKYGSSSFNILRVWAPNGSVRVPLTLNSSSAASWALGLALTHSQSNPAQLPSRRGLSPLSHQTNLPFGHCHVPENLLFECAHHTAL